MPKGKGAIVTISIPEGETLAARTLNPNWGLSFSTANIVPILGSAPEALEGLLVADVILIGGSGGKLPDILRCTDQLLKPGGGLL